MKAHAPIPCKSDWDRWLTEDAGARLLCRTQCPDKLGCLQTAVKLVDSQNHPTGMYGGVFLPDDRQTNDNPNLAITNARMEVRRERIKLLRSVLAKEENHAHQITG